MFPSGGVFLYILLPIANTTEGDTQTRFLASHSAHSVPKAKDRLLMCRSDWQIISSREEPHLTLPDLRVIQVIQRIKWSIVKRDVCWDISVITEMEVIFEFSLFFLDLHKNLMLPAFIDPLASVGHLFSTAIATTLIWPHSFYPGLLKWPPSSSSVPGLFFPYLMPN